MMGASPASMLTETVGSICALSGCTGRNASRRVCGRMNLLTVAVCVITVIAQLRRRRGLCLGNIPAGRILEDDFCLATILSYAASDAKLPTSRQEAHVPFVTLPDQHRY